MLELPKGLLFGHVDEEHGREKSHICSMKISQDVRDYAAKKGISDTEALEKGMEEKSIEFVKKGAEVYQKI